MLQVALLLLGCALSCYLWEVNITVALVVLSVTLTGVIFYLFVVVAGAAFESCPYQTPGASIFRHIIRYIRHRLLPTLRPVFISSRVSHLTQYSRCRFFLIKWRRGLRQPWYLVHNISSIPLLCVRTTSAEGSSGEGLRRDAQNTSQATTRE